MGFTDFVLFGTDCGVRPGGNRHADGTVYRDLGVWREKDRNEPQPIEVEGNFGGVVRTDWVYDASRLMLAGAIAHYRFNVVNCSDGALIPGAKPCVPEALELTTPPVDRAAFAAELAAVAARISRRANCSARSISAPPSGASGVVPRASTTCWTNLRAPPDFAAAYERMGALIAGLGDRYAHANAIVDGTLKALPRIAMFYGFRVADPAARARLYRVFIDEFRAIVAEMAERTDALLAARIGGVRRRRARPGRAAAYVSSDRMAGVDCCD